MSKDITPYENIESFNKDGQREGYQQSYFGDNLFYKCHYLNGDEIGYEEYYAIFEMGRLTYKQFYIR